MSYTLVDVEPDTPAWEEERRLSVGASEAAAVLGLSPYTTALDVYKQKQGIDKHFDPVLSFIGHQSEAIIHAWVERFSGVDVELMPGFMARSAGHPFVHASFDRVSVMPFTTWQFKTAHHYAGHHWDEGIPVDIRVQVQTEMLVAGTDRAAVVVWIGGREFRLFWEPRDEKFIQEQLIPQLTVFWDNTRQGVPPKPANLAEVATVWPSEEREIEASDLALEAVERRTVLLADIQAQQAEADALKLVIAEYMEHADTLTHGGRRILTFKSQKGRTSFDRAALEVDHPEIVAKYTSIGAPFKVMRAVKTKETNK
jgi:putative phage-type endonuclease